MRALTAYENQTAFSWMDVLEPSHARRTTEGTEDASGMAETLKGVEELVRGEVEGGIEPARIVVGGFSQGGGMAILEAMTGREKIGGAVVLSGYLPLKWRILEVSTT